MRLPIRIISVVGACAALALGVSLAMSKVAPAADLGGSCCEDLEQRVADLESTTARKGNKKVTLTISGTISYALLWAHTNDASLSLSKWWDADGDRPDIVQNPNEPNVIRFSGEGKFMPGMRAGFVVELNPFADDASSRRDIAKTRATYVYIDTGMTGKISLGFQKSAGDGSATSQIVPLSDVSGLLDISPLVHAVCGTSSACASSFPGLGFARADSIRYDNTNIGKSGIDVAASWAPEGDVYAASAVWAGKVGKIDLGVSGGYENQRINGVTVWGASAGVHDEMTGLFLQGGWVKNSTAIPSLPSFDITVWQAQGGIAHNWTALGDSAIYGEFGQATISGGSGTPHFWGAGVRQSLDGAASDVFVGYRAYDADNGPPSTTVSTILAGMTVRY